MSSWKKSLIGAGLALAFSTSAGAVTVTNDLSLWQSGAGDWTQTTTYGSEFDVITGFTATGGPSIVFDGDTAQVLQVGTSWLTWCCGYTGQVLYEGDLSATWNFATPIDGFGVYAEPNPFGQYQITLSLMDGTTLSQSVEGDSGAKFFGFLGTGVTSMTVSSSVNFALGNVFVSHIPEPETYGMLLAGLGLMGFIMRRRSRAANLAMA